MANAYLLRRGGYSLRSYFTNFPATEDPLSQSGVWRTSVNFYKAPETTPGRCFSNGTTDNFDDALAQLISPQLAANHRITTTVFRAGGYTPGVSHEIGHYLDIFINNANPANTLVSGFEMLFPYDSTSFQMVQWLGVNHSFPDNFSILNPTAVNGGLANVQNGDVLVSQIVGTDITVSQNGIVKYTLSGVTRGPAGGPGIGFYVNSGGGIPANFCITDYLAESL